MGTSNKLFQITKQMLWMDISCVCGESVSTMHDHMLPLDRYSHILSVCQHSSYTMALEITNPLIEM